MYKSNEEAQSEKQAKDYVQPLFAFINSMGTAAWLARQGVEGHEAADLPRRPSKDGYALDFAPVMLLTLRESTSR